jgi:4-amino-4-deoxychorismate lyase
MVTDSSYANLLFRKGDNYYTPSTPLLKGTMREKLLDEKKIAERSITRENIREFSEIYLMNAMLGIGEAIEIISE